MSRLPRPQHPRMQSGSGCLSVVCFSRWTGTGCVVVVAPAPAVFCPTGSLTTWFFQLTSPVLPTIAVRSPLPSFMAPKTLNRTAAAAAAAQRTGRKEGERCASKDPLNIALFDQRRFQVLCLVFRSNSSDDIFRFSSWLFLKQDQPSVIKIQSSQIECVPCR